MTDTFIDGADSLLIDDTPEPERPALVVLWSRSEPDRVGEVVLMPRRAGTWVLGRKDQPASARLGLHQQRPGRNVPTGELRSARLSRTQLKIQRDGAGALAVENVGKLAMRVNSREQQRARLQPGDLLELDRALLLMCVMRPEVLPGTHLSLPPFGAADADGIVGESPVAWELRRHIALCAETSGHVLIQGPSGAGKELVAQAIHRRSHPRRDLVSRNAATFPEGILDAELFGNLRDYPNPGMPARPGAVGEADGGSLFLDEIGETSHSMQAHLLRVLDSGEYQRLGESRSRNARFRLIGATNRDLETLKHDFLARFPRRIALEGLNQRAEDIPQIARHLLQRFAAENPGLFPGGIPRMHPGLVQALVLRRYTTHVREVSRLLWASVERWKLRGGKYLTPDKSDQPAPPPAAEAPRAPQELTREDVLAAYRRFGGVQARVPAFLGLRDRFQLARLEKKLGITRGDRDAAVKG